LPELDLASLDHLLQRVRRHPQDRELRMRAAQSVAALAEISPAGTPSVENDKLLSQAASAARLLRRALERANKNEPPSSNDIAAVNAWIDGLRALLVKAVQESR
jgi:hypothetical protein